MREYVIEYFVPEEEMKGAICGVEFFKIKANEKELTLFIIRNGEEESLVSWDNADISILDKEEYSRIDVSLSEGELKENIFTAVVSEEEKSFFWNAPVRDIHLCDDREKEGLIRRLMLINDVEVLYD